ncbi:TVP38/TMEM64 family protein [Hazenella sp. IB182357]|uniref:TVP38/TMEM64 family membrane protein n=2 Tax=Polycladospora coralii TaxID=2771432 RepID=A0A926RSN2_9BACL|nr:TVP38/TMEM64 family protein [Polycladospora coralii]MBS7529001.1 TVP38/TMEM64 family protein [Polycladospora coralii]
MPSAFITALNINLFGFVGGVVVSIIGEALGALVSFGLYRLGFQKFIQKKSINHPNIHRLLEVEGREAFILIFSLRLLPFVPSGLVTFFASSGKVSWLVFASASTLGKIPALLIEAYSIYAVLEWSLPGKIILVALAIGLLFSTWRLQRKK